MTFQDGSHMYMAGPFFNDDQKDLCSFIESYETQKLPIYSPRLDGGVLKPDSSQYDREHIFNSNVDAIRACSFVLAIIDDFDPGTIWEMGYAHGIGKPCVAYSDVEGRGLNVMLAGSSKEGFINGRDDLSQFLRMYQMTGHLAFPRNTWVGEIQ